MTAHIIIVAAGSGSRFGTALPKQYCLLAGRPVLMHTIERLRAAAPDAGLTLVVSADMHAYWQELCAAEGFDSPAVVHGGASRSESVRNAMTAMTCVPDVVLVHDGARPLVDAACVQGVLAAMERADVDGAIPAVAVTDSLRVCGAGTEMSHAVDRSHYRAVQTPQAFRGRKLAEAYASVNKAFSDDASLMEHCGYTNIVLTPGTPENIKITNPMDIAIAETILSHHSGK